jgi:hypothetical protein
MPPPNQFVWVRLREGEGFWYLALVDKGRWWVPGAKDKHPVRVDAWRPWQ